MVDLNDRTLRQVVVGLGGPANGVPREDRFDITAASEVMAILVLATDYADLRRRLGEIVIAQSLDGKPVKAEDIGICRFYGFAFETSSTSESSANLGR